MSFLQAPSLPAFLTARPPAVLDLCHHASEAQKQASCPRETSPGPGGYSGGPGQCCCSPRRGVPLLPLFCPSGFSLSSPAAGDRQGLQGAMAPSSPDAGPSCAGSDEGAQGLEEESAGASQAAPATQSTRKDPLARKARILVEFLLESTPRRSPSRRMP